MGKSRRSRARAFPRTPSLPSIRAIILGACRQDHRVHNVGSKYGRVIGFSPDDIRQLHEALKCPSVSFSGGSRPTGSSAALATGAPPRKSSSSARPRSSTRQSTVRYRNIRERSAELPPERRIKTVYTAGHPAFWDHALSQDRSGRARSGCFDAARAIPRSRLLCRSVPKST